MDNRRLAAFKMLGQDVPVTIVDFQCVENEFINKFTTINDGISVIIRGTGISIP